MQKFSLCDFFQITSPTTQQHTYALDLRLYCKNSFLIPKDYAWWQRKSQRNNEIKFLIRNIWKIYIFVVSYPHQIFERVQQQTNMNGQWLHIVY